MSSMVSYIAAQTSENVQSAKNLGITITENIDWGQHISEISFKATKRLGLLRRNLTFAPRSKGSCIQNFGSALTRVCSTHLEPLLETSD